MTDKELIKLLKSSYLDDNQEVEKPYPSRRLLRYLKSYIKKQPKNTVSIYRTWGMFIRIKK